MSGAGGSMAIKLQGGWSMDREKFSGDAIKIMEIAIDHRRQLLELPDDAMRGMRFKSNSSILVRLESMFTEAEFMECPGLRIDAALLDAARTDHWYEFEKDYEQEYSGYDCETADVDDDE